MPRTLELPEKPHAVYGVWNYSNEIASPNDTPWQRLRYQTGWRVRPTYNFLEGPVVSSQEELATELSMAERRWQIKCNHIRRHAAQMGEILLGRVITTISVSPFSTHLYLQNGGRVALDRTRGFRPVTMEGPTQGPFSITKILATHRTFRLDNGESLVFSSKMAVLPESIPDWILDDIFGP